MKKKYFVVKWVINIKPTFYESLDLYKCTTQSFKLNKLYEYLAKYFINKAVLYGKAEMKIRS